MVVEKTGKPLKTSLDGLPVGLRRLFVLVTSLLLLLTAALAQAENDTGQIAGIVRGPARAPIAQAIIIVTELGTKAVKTIHSSPDGAFLLPKVSAGSYNLTATAEGFVDFRQNVFVANGSRVHLDIHLVPASEQRRNSKGK